MGKPAVSTVDKEPLSHNLLGQRLGRKGRDTRERILAATEKLLAGPADIAISLSGVAREASLAMTTLYLYFGDLTELILAVLDPIMASADDAFVAQLRRRWPDEGMGEHCLRFVEAYYAFWNRHTRVLHLRNNMADNNDERMRMHRIAAAEPVRSSLVQQMEEVGCPRPPLVASMATVLMTGLERVVTVATDAYLQPMYVGDIAPHVRGLLVAEARVLELGIRDAREVARRAGT